MGGTTVGLSTMNRRAGDSREGRHLFKAGRPVRGKLRFFVPAGLFHIHPTAPTKPSIRRKKKSPSVGDSFNVRWYKRLKTEREKAPF